jgi:adenylate cyclase class 2
MPKEYEYKFNFNDDITEEYLRKKLKKMKAIHYDPIIFMIKVYNHPIKKDMYIRLRDEGYKKTFTIKQNLNAKFVDEYEIIINNIDIAEQMLLILGCIKKYEVEKIREIYKYDEIEIVLDSLPGLPTFFEIEAPSLKELNNFCKELNIDITKHDDDKLTYDNLYGLNKNRNINGNLTFNNAKNMFLPIINKNKKLFISILKKQKKLIKLLKN